MNLPFKKCSKEIKKTKQGPELISRAHIIICVEMLPPTAASVGSTGASVPSGRSCEVARVQIYCRQPQFPNRPCPSIVSWRSPKTWRGPMAPTAALAVEPSTRLSCCQTPRLLGTPKPAKQSPGVRESQSRASKPAYEANQVMEVCAGVWKASLLLKMLFGSNTTSGCLCYGASELFV